MIRIKIDNKNLIVDDNTPVITVAKEAGVNIPSMCYLPGNGHITSCMICLVKEKSSGKLFPSCSVNAVDGMDIITVDEEIFEARKTALELLLSEHAGDCEAPCQITCPAHMNIPLMNRLLAKGEFQKALEIVKKDIALPAVFGRICPAPCEGACHRKSLDEPVSICLLKRSAGDFDIARENPWVPETEVKKGKRISIIGAGPAGLSAAFHLQQKGYDCFVYDRNKIPGGSLNEEVKKNNLPLEVLLGEVEILEKTGVEIYLNQHIDKETYSSLLENSDALVIATGNIKAQVNEWGLEMGPRGIMADKDTGQIGKSAIFVVGSALKPSRMAIRALGQGKELSWGVDQFLNNNQVRGETFMFNSRIGRLHEDEFTEYLKESVKRPRIETKKPGSGLSGEQVMKEAERCLHCDCRDLGSCKLRIYSGEYNAGQKRFQYGERRNIVKKFEHDLVVYEPGKCIKCGICVKICSKYRTDFGLSFIGRGFEIDVGVAFNENLKKGLEKVAEEVSGACPTGALALK